MVVIKHGTAYEELDSYSCICPKCDCEFEYVKRDVHSYLNEECYVICPECISDIKLPYWSRDFEEVEEKMDDNIKFYIPNGITIPTALILYVGDIYVCYSKIKRGFRFHIHEDDEIKAMGIAKQIADRMIFEHDESEHGVTWCTVEFKIVEQEERYKIGTDIDWFYRIRDSY